MLEKLIESSGFWGVVGVILGFILAEGAELIRRSCRIKKLKLAMSNELKSLSKQIDQKIEIIDKAIQVLRKNNLELLATASIPFITKLYEQYFGELSEHFTSVERNCIHNVYERARFADRMLDSFETEYIDAIQTGKLTSPNEAFIGKLDDTKNGLLAAQELIKGILVGAPEDIYKVEDDPTRNHD